MRFRRVAAGSFEWSALEGYEERTFTQTPEWLDFLTRTQGGEAVIAVLEDAGNELGYFTGLLVRRYGIRMLGSPFPGTGTPFMGLALAPGVSRAGALSALAQFAFGELGCEHLEFSDPQLTAEHAQASGYIGSSLAVHVTDLSGTREQLLASMARSVRRNARVAQKNGLVVEEGRPEGFAEDYYPQVQEVFGRQGLKPPYGIDRVKHLIDACYPSGNLLLLRVRDADGKCVASSISAGLPSRAFGWGTGSYSAFWHLFPNELLFQHNLLVWQERGTALFDWGRVWSYKPKYGAVEQTRWNFNSSKRPWVRLGRELARNSHVAGRELRRKIATVVGQTLLATRSGRPPRPAPGPHRQL